MGGIVSGLQRGVMGRRGRRAKRGAIVAGAGHGPRARGGPCLHPGAMTPAREAVTIKTPCAPPGLDELRTRPDHRLGGWAIARTMYEAPRFEHRYRGPVDAVDM